MAKQRYTASTVVALRVGIDDFYHGGCEPVEAVAYTLGEDDIYEPEIVWRHCLECGKPILTQAVRIAAHDYFHAERLKHQDDDC